MNFITLSQNMVPNLELQFMAKKESKCIGQPGCETKINLSGGQGRATRARIRNVKVRRGQGETVVV